MVDSPVYVGDLARDSKDVLVQRLNDLALLLTREENLRDEVVTEMHNEVDRMEKAIHSSVWSSQNEDSITGKIPSIHGSLRSPGSDVFRSPFSPNRNVKMRLPEPPLTTSHSNLQEALEMSPKKIVLIANEAEFLNQKLRDTLQALQARKEETDVCPSNSLGIVEVSSLTPCSISTISLSRGPRRPPSALSSFNLKSRTCMSEAFLSPGKEALTRAAETPISNYHSPS